MRFAATCLLLIFTVEAIEEKGELIGAVHSDYIFQPENVRRVIYPKLLYFTLYGGEII